MRAGTLIVDIAANTARLSQDMATAKGVVQGAMNDITRSVNVAKTALGALGVGVGVGAMAQMALGINKATAALDDMAEVTGSAVAELSKLQVVAKIGGHDFGLVEDSLVKLTKGLKGTEEETKNARNALEQLGIKAKTAGGQQRDAGELMREVAVVLSKYGDDATKTAYALDIFGKSGAKLLPFLKDMAEEGTVAARVTAEQARQAEVLEKNLNRLKLAAEDSKREFLMGHTPALIEFTEKLLAAQKAAGGLAGALFTLATSRTGGNTVDRLAEIDREIEAETKNADVAKRLGAFGGIGGLGAKLGSFGSGARIGTLMWEREYRIGLLGRNAQGLEDDLSGTWRPAAALPRGVRKPPPETGKSTGKTVADLLNEGAGVSKDFHEDLQKLHAGFTSGRITIEQYRETVGKLIEKQGFAKDLAKQHAFEIKQMTEESKAAFEAEQKRGAQMVEFIATQAQEIEQLEFENSLIHMTTAEREKAVALRKIENDLKKQSKGLTDEEAESLRRESDALKGRISALYDTKAARDAAQKAAEEWKASQVDMWKSIDRVAHDTFVSIFDSGKSAFDRLKDTLKNGLYSLLYQMTVRPFIVNIAAMVSGTTAAQSAFGANGGMGALGALLGGDGGGSGGIGNLLSLGSSAYQGITGNSLMGNMITGLTGGAGLSIGGATIGASIAGLGGTVGTAAALGELGMMASATTAGMGAAGIGAAAAIPYVGWAIAAMALIASMSGKKGGPKPSQIGLFGDPGGSFNIGQIDTPGGWANLPLYQSVSAAFNDPKQYDQEKLNALKGAWIQGEPNEPADRMVQRLLQYLEPARAAAAETLKIATAVEAMREAIKSAQDPLGYWTGQVAKLGAELDGSVDTVAEWREAFLKAMDGTLSDEQLKKWERFGNAISQMEGFAQEQIDLQAARAAQEEEMRKQADELRKRDFDLQSASFGQRLQGSGVLAATLKDYVDTMTVSEFLSPTARLEGARGLFGSTLARARGGDVDAAGRVGGLAQSLLGAGRDVYASGPQFQQLFTEVNRDLQRVLEQQGQTQQALIAEMPISIREAANDTIAELRRLREEVRAGLDALSSGLRQFNAEAA